MNSNQENIPNFQAYSDLLVEAIKATIKSNADRNVVHPLLKKNEEILDNNFAKVWEIRTKELQPKMDREIATLINNLGTLFQEFNMGKNRASYLEMAIICQEAVSTFFARKTFPREWARTQNNLGNAYRERILGEKAENLELALAAYLKALEVYTREDFPEKWAIAQDSLGNAYSERILGDPAENIELAITAYEKAIKVRTPTEFPEGWAMSQSNWATAYWKRICGDREENIEKAINAYEEVLQKVFILKTFPEKWSKTKNPLGAAYIDRIRGDKAENLEKAIKYFQATLKEVYTREAFPINYAETEYNLGTAYYVLARQDTQKFTQAHDALADAINTVESLRLEILYGSGKEGDKQKLAEKWNELYQRMVVVCLELNKDKEAIEYVERGCGLHLL